MASPPPIIPDKAKKVCGQVKSGGHKAPSTIGPVSKTGNDRDLDISHPVDNSTEVEKTPPLPAIKVLAGGKMINPSSSTKSETSPQSILATGGMKDSDPLLGMIGILQEETDPTSPSVTKLSSSSFSNKPNKQSQVVARNAPTSSVTMQQPQQQRKSMPNDQDNTEREDKDRWQGRPHGPFRGEIYGMELPTRI